MQFSVHDLTTATSNEGTFRQNVLVILKHSFGMSRKPWRNVSTVPHLLWCTHQFQPCNHTIVSNRLSWPYIFMDVILKLFAESEHIYRLTSFNIFSVFLIWIQMLSLECLVEAIYDVIYWLFDGKIGKKCFSLILTWFHLTITVCT